MPAIRKPKRLVEYAAMSVPFVVGLSYTNLFDWVLGPFPFLSVESLVAFVFASRLSILLHEVGHAAAGLAAGFSFMRLVAWPIRIENRGKGLVLSSTRQWRIGFTQMQPRFSAASPLRTAAFSAGGVLANALGLIACLTLVTDLGSNARVSLTSPAPEVVVILALRWSVVFCAAYAILNLLPVRTPRLTWDGARVLDALLKNARLIRFDALSRLVGALERGATSEQLERAWVVAAAQPCDGTLESVIAQFLAYGHFIETDAPLAAEYLENALRASSIASENEQRQYAAECVVFCGWYRNDVEGARAWADWSRYPTLPPMDRLRVEAVLAWCDGRHADAIARLKELLASKEVTTSVLRLSLENATRAWLRDMEARAATP